MFIFNNFSTCFGHHYAHLQENKTYVTACGVLRWFCWMWLVAPHNRYQPHPAEPAQHTTCSNIRLVLLKMGIMMPETCWESIDNKHLTVASSWFSLSLHNLLTMHGHRNLKLFWWSSYIRLPVVNICTVCFNIQALFILSTQCVCGWFVRFYSYHFKENAV